MEKSRSKFNLSPLQVVDEQQKDQSVEGGATESRDHETVEDASQGRELVPYTPMDQVSKSQFYPSFFRSLSHLPGTVCCKTQEML